MTGTGSTRGMGSTTVLRSFAASELITHSRVVMGGNGRLRLVFGECMGVDPG